MVNDRLAQPMVSFFGSVSAESIGMRQFFDGLMHGIYDSCGKRTRHIAYPHPQQASIRMSGKISLRPNRYFLKQVSVGKLVKICISIHSEFSAISFSVLSSPRNTSVAGPVMKTGDKSVFHCICKSPPGK